MLCEENSVRSKVRLRKKPNAKNGNHVYLCSKIIYGKKQSFVKKDEK